MVASTLFERPPTITYTALWIACPTHRTSTQQTLAILQWTSQISVFSSTPLNLSATMPCMGRTELELHPGATSHKYPRKKVHRPNALYNTIRGYLHTALECAWYYMLACIALMVLITTFLELAIIFWDARWFIAGAAVGCYVRPGLFAADATFLLGPEDD